MEKDCKYKGRYVLFIRELNQNEKEHIVSIANAEHDNPLILRLKWPMHFYLCQTFPFPFPVRKHKVLKSTERIKFFGRQNAILCYSLNSILLSAYCVIGTAVRTGMSIKNKALALIEFTF